MMEFVYPQRREGGRAAQRSVAVGTRGMVSSSQYLATMAGARILRKGGNAVDAAVAMVSTLTVVEPQSVSIGGDAFALIYLAGEERLIGMNGSGRSPYRATIEWFTEHGMREIPEQGIYSVTVPGPSTAGERPSIATARSLLPRSSRTPSTMRKKAFPSPRSSQENGSRRRPRSAPTKAPPGPTWWTAGRRLPAPGSATRTWHGPSG